MLKNIGGTDFCFCLNFYAGIHCRGTGTGRLGVRGGMPLGHPTSPPGPPVPTALTTVVCHGPPCLTIPVKGTIFKSLK